MKRLLLLVVICAMCSLAFSQNGHIPLNPSATKSGSLQSNSMYGFSTTFSFNSIESEAISNEKGNFSEIYIDGSFPYGEVGSPSLPMVTRLIAIPEGATPSVTVNGYSESEYALADYGIQTLSAQQAPVRKSIDPTTVEYVVNNAAYASNAYTTDEIASVEYLGTMRGIRLGKLTIRPVSYNAAANTIKVRNDINVTVNFENANAALTQSMFASTYSPAFNSIYDQLLNKSIFGQRATRDAYSDHPDLYNTPVKMLVICYSGFRGNAALNQWLQWKLQKGYYVDIFYTDETGTSANNIKSFIQTKYNASVSAGNAYSYLIVIGDTGQVPQYMTKTIDSDIGECASDLGYAAVNFTTSSTTNYFPDMFYSRISVENETHLTNYINKVLTYEKYEFTDGGNYLNNVILVGGWDSSWTNRVAKPTINYGKNNYFNSTNTTYGGFENGTINATISASSTQGYSGTNNGCYNGLNNGVGFLNYTAHGDKQEWTQPKISAKQVETFTNYGKYFFGIGNCCLTGNFNLASASYSTANNPTAAIGTNACFAETMIRVPNAGAIAYVGCSPYSYWYEDFYWAVGAHSFSQGNAPSTSASTMGVYDAMFVDEYWNSASSLLYLGNLAVQQAITNGNTNSSVTDGNCRNSAHYYFQFYHTFGDGSVMPYVTKPEVNNVTHPASIMAGMTSLTVNAVAGSYVAVTDNESTIYGVAVANSQGVATVNFTEAIPATGTLHVVVTRQQYQPYFGTVDITIANEPYVSIESYSPQNVSFGTTNDLSMTLVNMGGVATEGNTTVNLTTSDEYLTLNTSTATFGVMAAQGGTASSSAFNFSVAENTPDGHVATINATITNGSHTWEGTMTVTVAGPACDAPTGLNVALNGADATITWDTQTITPVIISDDFEDHTYGTINSPGTVGWTYIDGDNATTGSFSINFTGENSKMAYIVLDYSSVTNLFAGHSGNKFIADAFISSSVQNDDWIISPELNFTENFTFSFWARSGASRYPDEQFYAAYSTTGNSASDFINLNSTVITTTTTWTQYSYNVPANAKYVAIHCVSSDQYLFCVDDITISGNIISGSAAVNLYDNGVLVASNLTSGTYTASNLAVGEHRFSIRAICDDNSESMSAQSCVTVESILPSYTITVNANNGGTVNPNGTQTVYEGNDFTFTATPNDCYEVASVTVDGNNVNLTNNQYTISNVTANHTVNVTFSQLTYTIAATVGNGGTITPAGNTTVNCGESQTYSIAANNGYRINEVTVDGQNMGAIETYTFSNVDANHTISATFIAVLTIDVTADAEGGSVSPTGTQTIDEGGSFTFTVTPETCYEIGNVTVNGTAVTLDANNQYTINNITSNQNINVTFNQLSYTITATAGNGGTINPGTTTVNCGGSQTYTIVPNEGYMISDVTVDGQSVGSVSSYSFTNVTANRTISATFVEIPDNHIIITVNADADGGSVSPSGSQSVEQGSDFTFTVTPDACYAIGTVTVNGTPVTLEADNSYTITNVTEAQTINVTFNQITYTVVVNAGNGGSIAVEGGNEVACGENKTFTVATDNCHTIAAVTVNGTEVTLDANNSYTIENVSDDQTIVATFNQISYTVAVNAGEGGTITPADGAVLCGENITFAIAANEGYEIVDVVVDGQSRGVITSYTFENVTDNEHSIAATFTQIVVPECNAVEGLEVSVEPYGNLISWTAAENAVSYNIFRNNDETALANVSTTSYADMNGQEGDTYYIVTVCQYGDSNPSESVQAIQTGIEGSSISVEIYPNPASDKFMIECEGMTTIEIFNVVGQSMGMIDVNSSAISIDSSEWTNGVYSVRITTENAGIIVKQIIKQ
jgi:gingipain K